MRPFALFLPLILVVFQVPAMVAQSSQEASEAFSFDPLVSTCPRGDRVCPDWVRFRIGVTGPYQSLAVADHGDRATVIISEADANRDELLALVDAAFGKNVRRRYHRWVTGLDGWLEDLVLDVPLSTRATRTVVSGHDLRPWNAPAPVVDRLAFIYTALHQTSDGFYVDDVRNFADAWDALAIRDLQLAPGHLRDWFEDPSKEWSDVSAGTAPVSVTTLQAARRPGVYVRTDRTLLALVVPIKTALQELKVPFRQFAVGSDLLLAAYRTRGGATVLLGRVRQLPTTVLPPLRFETFASFVRHRTSQLAQSYERQRIFAGRVTAGPFVGWDWAPILLSSQLDDSEFGTLLNQADQILKSWSQAGAVEYYAFDHREPESFPFGDESASDYFEFELGTTSLIFNWNTQNLTTITQFQGSELLTVDRFGALPILYLPQIRETAPASTVPPSAAARKAADARQAMIERLSREAADDARAYFARQGDPVLVRVVQNVLLYQATQAFLAGLAAAEKPGPARWTTVQNVLLEEATRWLKAVSAQGATKGLTPRTEQAVERLTRDKTLTIRQIAELIATPQATAARLASAQAVFFAKYEAALDVRRRLAEVAPEYEEAFRKWCDSVSGSLSDTRTDPVTGRVSKGLWCRYDRNPALTTSPATLRYEMLERIVTSLQGEIEALEKEMKQARADYDALSQAYENADALAQALAREAGFTAGLDRVLEQVRAAAAKAPVTGPIRTPPVVLSRNTDNVFAIGGHNIDFAPVRVGVSPLDASRPVPVPPPGSRPTPLPTLPLTSAPAPDAARALGTRGGTVLESMRVHDTPITAQVSTDLLRTAADCPCPVIRDTPDGRLLLATVTPPPGVRPLLHTEIVSAILGPPPLSRVRFEGLPLEVVDQIMFDVQRTSRPRSNRPGLRRAADLAASLFDTTLSGIPTRLNAFFKRTSTGETFAILADGDISIREPQVWQKAQVRPHTSAAADVAAVVVEFPGGGRGATISSVEVAVRTPDGPRPGAQATLQKALQTAVRSATPPRAAFLDGVEDLYLRLRRDMTSAEIRFLARTAPLRTARLQQVTPSEGAE